MLFKLIAIFVKIYLDEYYILTISKLNYLQNLSTPKAANMIKSAGIYPMKSSSENEKKCGCFDKF